MIKSLEQNLGDEIGLSNPDLIPDKYVSYIEFPIAISIIKEGNSEGFSDEWKNKDKTSTDPIKTDSITIDEQSGDSAEIQAYLGAWVWMQDKPFSALRIQGWSSLFKDNILQTDVFWFVDIDGNPLENTWYGELCLSKDIYKGVAIEATYVFTWSGNNEMKFWLSYGGILKNGWYKVAAYPISFSWKLWKSFDIILEWSTKIWKKWNMSSFIEIYWLDKSFYWETEFAYDFWKHIAWFVQARYGGPIKDPFLTWLAWIRLNIK